jgi:hypothetical protein
MFSIVSSVKFENISILIYAQCVYTQHTLLFQNSLDPHLCVYAHSIYTHFAAIFVLIYVIINILLFIIIYLLLYYILLLLLLLLNSNMKTTLKYLNHDFVGPYKMNNIHYGYFDWINMLWRR